MKIVLFDLGKTLEDDDILLPGARETLAAIAAMHDAAGDPAVLAVVSNFDMPTSPEVIDPIRQRYYDILENLGIRSFFEPVAQRVTLSTEVGVPKPRRRIFQAAVDKVDPRRRFEDVIFITEDPEHVAAARRFGMEAVHFQGPGQSSGDIQRLVDLIPLVEVWLALPARAPVSERGPSAAGSVSVAACSLPTGSAGLWRDPSAPLGAGWVQFGEEMLLLAPEGQRSALAERGAGSGVPIRELRDRVDREHLHLVIQKGDLFQKNHPEVPVLLDRGRFLVVELDPERAARLDPGDEPCYTV
jgi:hypothetical protein